MEFNSKLAATGLCGSITTDRDYLAKGTIDEWVYATAIALADSKRVAGAVTYMPPPSGALNGGGKKAKKLPLIIVAFRTKDELEKATGPISIMGITTEIVKFRAPNGLTFRIPPRFCFQNGEKLCRAFEEQAMVKLGAWGWRQFMGTKSEFVLQCQLPPRRDPDTIEVDGWKLKCIRVEEEKCCCCGEAHNCFASDVKCRLFALGYRLWDA